MSRRIEYYFSLLSPWTYIGHRFFLDIARRHSVGIIYKPVMLNEVFSQTGGLPLAKRHPARQAYRMLELQRWREKRRLEFHLRPKFWPYEADLANRATLAIVATGGDPAAFVSAVLNGVWEREDNLADRAVLARLLGDAGFNSEKILAQANSEAIGAVYERNRHEAVAAGVFGAPSYILDGEIFWGQDRLELLDDALTSGRPHFSTNP